MSQEEYATEYATGTDRRLVAQQGVLRRDDRWLGVRTLTVHYVRVSFRNVVGKASACGAGMNDG